MRPLRAAGGKADGRADVGSKLRSRRPSKRARSAFVKLLFLKMEPRSLGSSSVASVPSSLSPSVGSFLPLAPHFLRERRSDATSPFWDSVGFSRIRFCIQPRPNKSFFCRCIPYPLIFVYPSFDASNPTRRRLWAEVLPRLNS